MSSYTLRALSSAISDVNCYSFSAMERKYLEEKSRLVKETEKRIIEIKTQSREAAQSGLDADTRKIVTDNRRMVRYRVCGNCICSGIPLVTFLTSFHI